MPHGDSPHGQTISHAQDVRERGCIICSHARREAIESACDAIGAKPFAIAEAFGVTRAALRKHDSHPRATSTPTADIPTSAIDARRRAPTLVSACEERAPETVRSARFDQGARAGMSFAASARVVRAALEQPNDRSLAILDAVDRLVRVVLGTDVEPSRIAPPLKQSGGS